MGGNNYGKYWKNDGKKIIWQKKVTAYMGANVPHIFAGHVVWGGDSVSQSGEVYALQKVCDDTAGKAVIFDVGANVGKYTKLVLDIFDNPVIHCFEPSLETYKLLQKNMEAVIEKTVMLNNLGCSDRAGEKILYSNKIGSGLSSLYNRQLDMYDIYLSNKETVNLITIDEYCDRNKVDHIDLLKLDVEGNEYKALLGAKNMIDKGDVKFIQFEFGESAIDARVFFRDIWNYVSDKYYVYRELRDGLYKIEKYDWRLEIFTTVNYFLIRKNSYTV